VGFSILGHQKKLRPRRIKHGGKQGTQESVEEVLPSNVKQKLMMENTMIPMVQYPKFQNLSMIRSWSVKVVCRRGSSPSRGFKDTTNLPQIDLGVED